MAFVRYAPVASAIALGVVDVVLLIWDQGVAILAGAGSLVLAIVGAYGLAVLRTRSLSATARIVDQELALQDRAISALQFLQAPDAISRLVVADAGSRLERIPASRLTLTVPVSARWLAVSAFTISAIIVVTLASSASDSSFTSDSSSATGSGRASAVVVRQSQASRARRLTPGAVRPGDDGRATTSPSAATADVSAGQPNTRDEGRRTDNHSDPGGATMSKRSGSDRTREPIASPRDRGSRAVSELNGTSAEGGRARGHAAQESTSTLSAAGRGASTPAGSESARGGVGGGPLVSIKSRAPSKSPTIADRQSAAYGAAYARAESAIPIERVPAGLRSYVRAYFLAIRPTSSQWR